MRTKKVTRHYCDFCSKGMFMSDAMRKHESICFSNPKRVCYLCEDAMADTGEFAKEFAKKHEISKDSRSTGYIPLEERESSDLTKDQVDEIRKAVNNCPACILSILKQCGGYAFGHFDYKKEKDAYLSEKHREEMANVGICEM